MRLHDNSEAFEALVALASDFYKIDTALVEKDYYVTLMLRELVSRVPGLLFKGGTSLSKCYGIIDRFSEDIDLTLEDNCRSQRYRKMMKLEIVDACKALGLRLLNLDDTGSKKNYNCYEIEYPIHHFSSGIKPLLLVETTYTTSAYPSEIRLATSMLYNYLKETGNETAIEKYELIPFDIRVQSLERTLVDKVFALCDYVISGRTERNSRHIYDLSRLLTRVKPDDTLRELVIETRLDRRGHPACLSAAEGVNVQKLLSDIVGSGVYRDDYETVTSMMLYRHLPYDEAIKAVETIIESGVFED